MISNSKREEHLNGFQKYMESHGHIKEVVKTYRGGIRRFLENNPWGDRYKYKDVLDYLEKVNRSPLSLSARKSILIYLKKYYDYLLEIGYRQDHPCRTLNLQGKIDKSIIHSDLISMAELEPLVDVPTEHVRIRDCYRAFMSLLVYQGLSSPEITRLSTKSIDLDKGLVHIKGGDLLMSRTLELHPKQYEIMDTYIHESREMHFSPKSDNLFFSLMRTNLRVESIRGRVECLQPMVPGKRLTPRTIRDGVISYWLNDLKVPLDQVQLMAGHRWISSTERYVKVSAEEQQEMLKKFHPMG